MPNAGDVPSRKCLSGVLSRLLCSGSLPTHPSEQLNEKLGDQKPGKGGDFIKQVVGTPAAASSSSPGVVARLMGLESFPTTPIDRSLGAYFRSKSVNSIDFLSYFDPVKHGQHRRVRTSVSFRYQEVTDDFTSIILDEKLAERRKNREKFQVCNRPGKNRECFQDSGPANLASSKMELRRNKLKERRATVTAENSKEDMVRSKCVRKKKKKILVHCNKKIHPQGIIPEVASSRNQLLSKPAKSQKSTYSRSSYSENVNAITAGKIEKKLKIEESCYYKRMVEEICMLSEEDVKENWIEEGSEDFDEIIQQLGHEIVQVLLNQFVDELIYANFLGQGI